jgi:hypothetical protein
MRGSKRELKRFEAWLGQEIGDLTLEEPHERDLSLWRHQLRRDASDDSLVGDTQEALKVRRLIDRDFNGDAKVVLKGGAGIIGEFRNFRVTGNSRGVDISDLHFDKLEIIQNLVNGPILELRNCRIRTHILFNFRRVRLTNCWIGSLVLEAEVGDFGMFGGAVLGITCSAAHGRNPFVGSVNFTGVHFPRAPSERVFDAQPYRNMRAHMQRLENAPMVSLFHTLEQAVERRMETNLFNRFVSHAYELLSDYGSSIPRPASWFLGLLLLTSALASGLDWAVANPTHYAWQEGLARTSHWRAVERGLLLTLQGTLNPFGIFGSVSAVLPRNGFVVAWMFFHGLFSATLAALFILALRRRFKMS